MFSDTALSCCLLLLASGCSIYITGKWSTYNFSKLQPEFIGASVGVIAINFRSALNLLSPFYYSALYRKYTFICSSFYKALIFSIAALCYVVI
jgi:hypothetical protein